MSKKTIPKNKTSGKDKNSQDDMFLWEFVTKDVTPLDGKKIKKQTSQSIERTLPSQRLAATASHPKSTAKAKDLDRNTETRFRKGEMKIEATLDLHGLNLAQAHKKLLQFVSVSLQHKLRKILVITGKGSAENPSKIKQSFKDWLDQAAFSNDVLKITQAQNRHGGLGAFYILLRRSRD
jgi:DNA-nicking Smr family endonuclease